MAKQQKQSIVAHYMQQIKESALSKDCVYRGQADAKWPLQSGVERRMRKELEDADDGIPSDSIKSYHDDLLDKARERGFGRVDGRDLDDLELLAALQHFGAATSLLDFTKQALVALYFACRAENEKDGKIFIVPYRTIPSASGKEIIKDLLTNDKPSLWRPMLHGAAERRIMTQAGLFLINITENHKDMQHVIISKKDKKKILEELDSTYQISAETLFMDLSGFAQNQTADKAFSDHLIYLYNGITKHQKGNLKEAIKDFNKAIRLKPDDAAVYWWRGMMKYKLNQHEEAFKDFDEAIRLKPDYANAYWGRGVAKDTLEQYEEAIKDFDEAIRLKPDDAAVYWWRGVAKDTLEQHDEAIKDFDEIIRLKPDHYIAYWSRGLAWSKLGDNDKARPDLLQALKLAEEQGKQEAADKIIVDLKKLDS